MSSLFTLYSLVLEGSNHNLETSTHVDFLFGVLICWVLISAMGRMCAWDGRVLGSLCRCLYSLLATIAISHYPACRSTLRFLSATFAFIPLFAFLSRRRRVFPVLIALFPLLLLVRLYRRFF
jgi:hypothetical protein